LSLKLCAVKGLGLINESARGPWTLTSLGQDCSYWELTTKNALLECGY